MARYLQKPIHQWLFAVVVLLGAPLATGIFNLGLGGGALVCAASGANDANQPSGDANEPNEQPLHQSEPEPVVRPDHNHPAFGQRRRQRGTMVQRQIRRRGVRDPNVLRAMETVPRHAFVRSGDQRRAYDDQPLPIGLGQTISQPYIVAYMTESLELKAGSKVLEIGTGSGYQAAVCAEIAGRVYTIEILEDLAKQSAGRLKKLGYANILAKHSDGYYGWDRKGPFDAIIVTCAAGLVPPPLIEQLKPGGRMILPLGSPFGVQRLVKITKDEDGEIRSQSLMPVRFVPMLGEVRKSGAAGAH